MRNVFIHSVMLMLLCAVPGKGWAQSNLVGFVDSLLVERQRRAAAKYDTAYIGLPAKSWTVKVRVTSQAVSLNTDGNIDGLGFRSELDTKTKNTLGATVSFRGLSLGFSINPAKLAGKNKDNAFNLSSYGNRMGVDLAYSSSKTLSGTAVYGNDSHDVATGIMSMEFLEANAYYSFNSKRFSFPAAFTQSQVQKRSCGSWLAGLSAFVGKIEAGAGVIPGMEGIDLLMVNAAIGAGYAYNLVAWRRLLLHISAMPHIVVYSYNRLEVGGARRKAPFKFPAFVNVGRLAATYNFRNSFVGGYAIVNLWNQGDDEKMKMNSLRWRARLFYGFRF